LTNLAKGGEGYYKVNTTLDDAPTTRASVIDKNKLTQGNLHFRGLEAGPGVRIDVVDVDNDRFITDDKKIVITATGSGGGSGDLLVVDIPITSSGQTVFSLPAPTLSVHIITVNGIEATDFLLTLAPPTLFVNDTTLGYILEPDDQLLVFYKV